MSHDAHPVPAPLAEAQGPSAAQLAGAETPAWRLVATLAVAGALAGSLIVSTFQWAQPRIATHQAEVLRTAVDEVLSAPARTDRFFVHGGALVRELPAGTDTAGAERVFAGYDAAGRRVGFAVLGGEPGFQDVISLIFGYDPDSGRVLGIKVLGHKETPGLGDKIVNDSSFVASFRGALAPLKGVKPGTGSGVDTEVDLITGATISSRAVVQIVNHRIEAVGPVLASHREEGRR